MKLRSFFLFVTLLLSHAVLAADKPLNILFLFTDDHAEHAISAYGSKVNKTPNIDRLAAEGMIFRNNFCTNSICGPSRAVILTGKFSHLNGFMRNGNRFDGSQQTFPKLLQKAGYQTAVIGKWHLETDPTGFDFWQVYPGQGDYYNPVYLTPNGRKQVEGYSVEITTDIALQWLDKDRDKSKPFMLMCQYKAPHRNWMPGPKYLTMYDDVELPEPPTLFDDYKGRGTAATMQEMEIGRHMFLAYDLKLDKPAAEDPAWTQNYLNRLTPAQREAWDKAYGPKNEAFEKANLQGKDLLRWKYQRYMKDYLRCVAAVDDNIGRLLKYLDDLGLAENTVVMYSSDQGFYLGDHGWYDKRWMYEPSLRMPLIVRWPGVTKPGSEQHRLTQNLDFAETFLEIAGVPIPEDMQGKSLVPLLKGEQPADWRKSIYYEYYEYPSVHMVNKHYGVRTDRYKLMYFHELDEWEFYDLKEDPNEMTSGYADPKYADKVSELKAELVRLRKQYGVVEEVEARNERLRKQAAAVRVQQVVDWADGAPRSAGALNPAIKPITVGAKVTPESRDGVIVAHGGESFGYGLYLKGGRAVFAVRSNGVLTQVGGGEVPLHTQSHIVGILDAEATLRVMIDGKVVATDAGQFIESNPSEGLSVGRDTGSNVGDYSGENPLSGEIKDLRIYWGVPSEDTLTAWAR